VAKVDKLIPAQADGAGNKPLTFWQRYRATVFQVYLVGAVFVFLVLAVLATTVAYFAFDVSITRTVQSIHAGWFAALMFALSWPGFEPQTYVISAIVMVTLYLERLIWETVVTLTSGICGSALGLGIKAWVERPRPSADLVHVFQQLNSYSFPSGHVLYYTTFGGFLFFLAYTLRKPDWVRTVLLVVLGGMVALIGLSRIYEGQHWASDVLGSYLLGSVLLSLVVLLYRWGKPRYFVDQPVAKETRGSR
jgi:membrane-associated phospholipid phosphatase